MIQSSTFSFCFQEGTYIVSSTIPILFFPDLFIIVGGFGVAENPTDRWVPRFRSEKNHRVSDTWVPSPLSVRSFPETEASVKRLAYFCPPPPPPPPTYTTYEAKTLSHQRISTEREEIEGKISANIESEIKREQQRWWRQWRRCCAGGVAPPPSSSRSRRRSTAAGRPASWIFGRSMPASSDPHDGSCLFFLPRLHGTRKLCRFLIRM